jgi:hypothetical protein
MQARHLLDTYFVSGSSRQRTNMAVVSVYSKTSSNSLESQGKTRGERALENFRERIFQDF